MGAYHTLDLEVNRKFTLSKAEWDTMDLERLEQCADVAHTADLAAIIMHEGLGNVCLITPAMTVVKAKIDMHVSILGLCIDQQHGVKSIHRMFSGEPKTEGFHCTAR